MVKSKTKSISNQGTFSNFSKSKCSIYNFLKIPHEIEATAICFVMERGRRSRVSKTPENACVHRSIWFTQYETCLTYPNRNNNSHYYN